MDPEYPTQTDFTKIEEHIDNLIYICLEMINYFSIIGIPEVHEVTSLSYGQ